MSGASGFGGASSGAAAAATADAPPRSVAVRGGSESPTPAPFGAPPPATRMPATPAGTSTAATTPAAIALFAVDIAAAAPFEISSTEELVATPAVPWAAACAANAAAAADRPGG